MQFVDGVLEIETPQQRVGCQFRGAKDVAAAICLDFGEREELADAAIEVTPDPLVTGRRNVSSGEDIDGARCASANGRPLSRRGVRHWRAFERRFT
jgi:hypothetical protein